MKGMLESSCDFFLGKRTFFRFQEFKRERTQQFSEKFPFVVWFLAQIWLVLTSIWRGDFSEVRENVGWWCCEKQNYVGKKFCPSRNFNHDREMNFLRNAKETLILSPKEQFQVFQKNVSIQYDKKKASTYSYLTSCVNSCASSARRAISNVGQKIPPLPPWEKILDFVLGEELHVQESNLPGGSVVDRRRNPLIGELVMDRPTKKNHNLVSRTSSKTVKKQQNLNASSSENSNCAVANDSSKPALQKRRKSGGSSSQKVSRRDRTQSTASSSHEKTTKSNDKNNNDNNNIKLKPKERPPGAPNPTTKNLLAGGSSPCSGMSRSPGSISNATSMVSPSDLPLSSEVATYTDDDLKTIRMCIVVLQALGRFAAPRTPPNMTTVFDSPCIPTVSISHYCQRIVKYFGCSASCFPLALLYIDRLTSFTGIQVSRYNIHRLLLASLVGALKFYDDYFYSNYFYATAGGLPLPEFNLLERHFLRGIRYKLHFSHDEFCKYLEIAASVSA